MTRGVASSIIHTATPQVTQQKNLCPPFPKPHLILATEPLQCQDGRSYVSLQPFVVAAFHHATQLPEIQLQIQIDRVKQQGNTILAMATQMAGGWIYQTVLEKRWGSKNLMDDQLKNCAIFMVFNANVYLPDCLECSDMFLEKGSSVKFRQLPYLTFHL